MTADELIGALQALVAAGEYLDEIPGVPVEKPSGPGGFRLRDDGRYSRLYRRGSAEYLAAQAAGRIAPLPPLRPAPPAAVAAADAQLGLTLPPLLRRLYTEVGDGGFGPGYGLLSLAEAAAGAASFPGGLVPVCDWGCGIASLVDCSDPAAPMWGDDPNPTGGDGSLFEEHLTLAEWLAAWLRGDLHQPTLIQDPATGEWRGATGAEFRAMLAGGDA